MRIGVVITKDEAGKQYVLADKGNAIELATTEIGALKDQLDHATDNGLEVGAGKSKIRMVAGILLTNNGLVKRRRFKV